MNEENKEVVDQEQDQGNKGVSLEDRAKAQGWRPKEEFDGDVSKWVSAETFLAKGELIEKIEYLGKKLKASEQAIDMLKQHHGQVKEAEFKRAVEFLKAQKKKAYEDGDASAIIAIDDKIDEVKEAARVARQEPQIQEEEDGSQHPAYIAWEQENTWYGENANMKKDADAIGIDYARAHPSLSPERVLKYVTQEMKKLYPEKFSNPLRKQPSAVEGGDHKPAKSSGNFQLTEDEKRIMHTFVNQGIMTKEEYIEELRKVKGM